MENFDYEKSYKAVLQTATQWIKDGCTDKEKICLESVFPELRESEDERIRKELIGHCKDLVRMNKDDKVMLSIYEPWLTWLEKQKEQKPAEWSEEDEQYLLVCKNALQKYQRTDQWDASFISAWLEERLKSLRPPASLETERGTDERLDERRECTSEI